MADTIRSKSALQTLLADNTSGDISPQDARDVLVSTDPENAVQTGAFASLPAAQKGGFLYFTNNGWHVIRDTGAAFAYWGPLMPMTPPVDSGFAWINQGSATITTTRGGMTLFAPSSASDSLRIYKKTAPATPWSLTVHQLPTLYPGNSCQAGILFRQSSDGKLASFQLAFSGGGWLWQSSKWTNATTFSANYSSIVAGGQPYNWLKVEDNGTNRICSFSSDGVNFVIFHSVSRTDFLTADEFGLFLSSGNSKDLYNTYLSYAVA